jgi:hypothetical protein
MSFAMDRSDLVLNLPPVGLRRSAACHLLFTGWRRSSAEKTDQIFAQLNVRHGPNTRLQIVRANYQCGMM